MSTSDIDPRDDHLSDEHPSDTAFDRLRATDPAASAEPDAAVIRAKVDAPVAGAPTAHTAPAGAPTTAPAVETTPAVVDLAEQRRTRRPARWLQVAAAAAGIVAVGGGAFFAGQQSADTPVTAQSSDARDATGPASPEGPAVDGASPALGFSAEAQPGARDEAKSTAAMDTAGYFFGRTVFTSSGLSDAAPAAAQAWGYDPSTTFSAETAARVAAALGVDGDPALQYGSWHVGSTDWTTPTVDLSSDSQTSFYYSDPTIQPWMEGSTATGVPADEAVAALTAVMTELGLDPAGYTITPDDQDPSATSVMATPAQAVDGNGSWYASVTTEGMANLSGALAPRVDLGTYDVVSPQTAVDRLSDERFGAAQSGIAYAAGDVGVARGMDSMTAVPDDPAAVPTLPAAPVAGAAIAWPVTTVTITEATLTTASYVQPDGSVVLLPTYTLTGSDTSVWTVLAIADAHVDFAATS